MTAIRAEHVAVRFRDRQVLDDISFDIAAPGLVVVVGPNGAGKSTVLRALAGLVPLQAGAIHIGDVAVSAMSPRQRSTIIGYLPQERTVHWPLRARRIVELGRLPHGSTGARPSDRAVIERAMADMDVTGLSERPILELSGGERARVLIARVLAQEPAVILADEPTAGLDPGHQWALFERLEASAARGIRIVVALHDLALASRFACHVILVTNGRIAAVGPPAEVLTSERLAEIFHIDSINVDYGGRRLIVPLGRHVRST